MSLLHSLLQLHTAANLGIYFDGVDTLDGGLEYAWSRQIKDHYWNYGLKSDGSPFAPQDLENVIVAAAEHECQAAFWQEAGRPEPEGWQIVSSETWMTADLSEVEGKGTDIEDITVEVLGRPSTSMVDVFNDAYSSPGDPSEAGYFELPSEYGQSFATGQARSPAKSYVIGLITEGRTVAVASTVIVADYAGLYSVATRHDARRKGFGRLVSIEALRVARNCGAKTAFLQTEVDSTVEEMYSSIGFKRQFVGTLLVRST